MVHRKRKLLTYYSSWILAMLSRDSGHFSNLRRNRNKLTKYRQKSDFSAARNRFVKTFYDIFFLINDCELKQKFSEISVWLHSMKVVFRYIHSNNVTVKRPLARRVDRDIRWNVCNETQVQDPTLLEGW